MIKSNSVNDCKLEFNSYADAQKYSRYATDQEKQLLFDALEKDGKRWNAETKQIEDIFKVGDLCIMWDDVKSDAIISALTEREWNEVLPDGYQFRSSILNEDNDRLCFKNAIKFESVNQYLNFIKKQNDYNRATFRLRI